MKKFIKMSLVAAVAVAGLSSTSSARTLAEVADNVNVFGYVQIRADQKSTTDTTAPSTSDDNGITHKEVIGLTGKINDDLSYMFAGANLRTDDTTDGADYKGFLMVYNYFTYTGIKDTSISFGRQGLDTPLTVVYDPADATSEATGLSLTSKLGPVTLNLARFSSTDFDGVGARYSFPGAVAITGGETYTHLGLAAKVGPVAVDAWYANMEDQYDTFTVGASAKLKAGEVMVSPYARYAAADIENVNADQSIAQAGVTVKAGIIGGAVAYGASDKEGSWVTFDKDAKANIQGWNISMLGNADADLLKLNLNVDVLKNLNLAANYTTMDVANVNTNELYAQAKYQMSSNFSSTLKIGQIDGDTFTAKRDVARLDLLWSF